MGNGEGRICYVDRGKLPPEDWLKFTNEHYPNGFMVVGAISGRGLIPLIKVSKMVKINSSFYIECILKPIFEKEIPKLYPSELNKVFFHYDKASSHTSAPVQEHLNNLRERTGITFINNCLIPVMSPDASLLDFYGFGYLKQRLFKSKAKNINMSLESSAQYMEGNHSTPSEESV
jgi:hypothetical protein